MGSSSELKAIALSLVLHWLMSFIPNLILVSWLKATHFMFILNCGGASNNNQVGGECILGLGKVCI